MTTPKKSANNKVMNAQSAIHLLNELRSWGRTKSHHTICQCGITDNLIDILETLVCFITDDFGVLLIF